MVHTHSYPPNIGSYWTVPIGKKKSSPARSLILDQTLDHSYWQIWTGNFSALTVCIHRQPCFLPVPRPALKHRYDYVLGNSSQWKATPPPPHASNSLI